MKKLLLSGVALAVCMSAFAQDAAKKAQDKLPASIANQRLERVRPVDDITPLRQINSTTVSTSKTSGVEVVIGTTEYDLQSNYGTCGNRVKIWDDGTLSATWTRGIDGPSYPDRGTGYNYWDGTNWGASPTMRAESARTGWPNVAGTSMNAEFIVNHAGNYTTNFLNRNSKGTGAWTEDSAGALVTWPRVVAGGANGTTVHVIGNDNATNFWMTYSRSTDAGATWVDIDLLLPDLTTRFFEGAVDGYDLDAKGDVVAIVMGGWTENLTLWKSMDNGATWTTTEINTFPLAPYDYTASGSISDVDNDGIADTVLTSDSGPSVVIDNNGMVHVACGLMRVLDDDPAAGGSYSYFPGTDGLIYWNEGMGANTIINNVIAEIQDRDGNGTIDVEPAIALYQCSLTGMPAIAVDAANNVHLAFSSLQELTTNGAAVDPQSYRNAYYMNSADGGMTWTTPVTIEESDFDEQVFVSAGKRVDDNFHVIYHKDGEPGTQIGPDEDPASLCEVIYNGVSNPFVGINELELGNVKAVIYPNPVSSVLNVDYTFESAEMYTVQLVNTLGQVAYSQELRSVTGVNNVRIPVSDYATGVYMLTTTINDKVYSERVIIQ